MGVHYTDAFYRHGGGTSAISQALRLILIAREIAGQARNDGLGLMGFVVQSYTKNLAE